MRDRSPDKASTCDHIRSEYAPQPVTFVRLVLQLRIRLREAYLATCTDRGFRTFRANYAGYNCLIYKGLLTLTC